MELQIIVAMDVDVEMEITGVLVAVQEIDSKEMQVAVIGIVTDDVSIRTVLEAANMHMCAKFVVVLTHDLNVLEERKRKNN